VAAPVGLEIGSQSVIEIAISIVAELIARRNLGPQAVAPRLHETASGIATASPRSSASGGVATRP
jgi:xanthine dehydrogenase accessory factor